MAFLTKILFAFLFVSFVAFVASESADIDGEQELQEEVTLKESINQFSAQFYKQTAAENPGKNLIMSPLSAEISLAMLSLGATDETLFELNKALYLPSTNFTKSAFKPALKKLNSVQGVTLKIANKVFVKEGPNYVLTKNFKDNAIYIFQSEVQNLEFSTNYDAAKTINAWAEKKTNKKIKDLIDPLVLNWDTRLVLVNAIYFKGVWETKFNILDTRKMDFHLNTKDKTQVDMMHKTGSFFYADIPEWDAKILELPYEKNEMSMVIVLPNQIEGLAAIEEKLAGGASLNDMLQRVTKEKVIVDLPKFKIETSIDLKKVLSKMGINLIFNEANNQLRGLLENDKQLHVSAAVQKVFIEVNEEGATAVTDFRVLTPYSPPVNFGKTYEFKADHPFLFFINNQNYQVLNGVYGKHIDP